MWIYLFKIQDVFNTYFGDLSENITFIPRIGFIINGAEPGYYKFICKTVTKKNGLYMAHSLSYLYDTHLRNLQYILIGQPFRLIIYIYGKITEEPSIKVNKPGNSVKLFSYLF